MAAYRSPLGFLEVTDASSESRPLLEEAGRRIGMVPNMYRAMAHSAGLFETYLDGYDRFRSSGRLSPAEQEVVFLVVSRFNECRYCVAAHSVLADTASAVPREVTEAIREDRPIEDPRLGALGRFTAAMLERRGRPTVEDVDELLAAGFTHEHVLEVVLAIAVKTISNYTNHLFETELDAPFAARAWQPPLLAPSAA